jgi:hypothetical protein
MKIEVMSVQNLYLFKHQIKKRGAQYVCASYIDFNNLIHFESLMSEMWLICMRYLSNCKWSYFEGPCHHIL